MFNVYPSSTFCSLPAASAIEDGRGALARPACARSPATLDQEEGNAEPVASGAAVARQARGTAATWPSVTTPARLANVAGGVGSRTARREERSKNVSQREYDQSGGDRLRADHGLHLADAARGSAYRALNLIRRVLDAAPN